MTEQKPFDQMFLLFCGTPSFIEKLCSGKAKFLLCDLAGHHVLVYLYYRKFFVAEKPNFCFATLQVIKCEFTCITEKSFVAEKPNFCFVTVQVTMC